MLNSTADKFLVGSLLEIGESGMHTKYLLYPVRTKYADGSPAHYITMGPTLVEYDILKGDLPINTLRPFPIQKSINEIRWIYQKQSNKLSDAHDLGIHWWDAWDIGDGTIGQRYGATVRRYNLMGNLINTFINDPLSRRKMMSLWQEQDFIDDTKGLKPCAHTTQWDIKVKPNGDHDVTLTLYQRSMDLLVTSSINAFQYYILGEALMAYLRYHTGKSYRLVKLRHDIGDVHIYDRHVEAALEIMDRVSDPNCKHGVYEPPTVEVPQFIQSWDKWTWADFQVFRPKIEPLENPIELAI